MPRKPTDRRVFISYRRADSSGHAGRLQDSLEAEKWTVVRDVSDLQPGDPFEQALGKLVPSVSAMIVMIGPDWAGTSAAGAATRLHEPGDFVRLEVQAGLEDPSVLVVPILVDGAKMPTRDAIPDVLHPLLSRGALEFRDPSWSFDVGVLVGRLEAHVGGRIPAWSWVAAAVVVVGLGAYVVAQFGDAGPIADPQDGVAEDVARLMGTVVAAADTVLLPEEERLRWSSVEGSLTAMLVELQQAAASGDSTAAMTLAAVREGSPVALTTHLLTRPHTDAEAVAAAWARSGSGVRIFSVGEPGDAGAEVTLVNTGTSDVDLTDWRLARDPGGELRLDGWIAAGDSRRLSVPGPPPSALVTLELLNPSAVRSVHHGVMYGPTGVVTDLGAAPAPQSFSYAGPARAEFVPALRRATGLVYGAQSADHAVAVTTPELAFNEPRNGRGGGWYLPPSSALRVAVGDRPCRDPGYRLGGADGLGWPGNDRSVMEPLAAAAWEEAMRGDIAATVSSVHDCIAP